MGTTSLADSRRRRRRYGQEEEEVWVWWEVWSMAL